MVHQIDKPMSENAVASTRDFLALTRGKNVKDGRAAKALLEWIADAGTDEPETTLEEIQDNFQDDDHKDVYWVAVLKALAERGAGRFVVGRHSHPSRFAWQGGSSLEVACRCLGRSAMQSNAASSGMSAVRASATRSHASRATEVIIHRSGRIEVRLPQDVRGDELAALIKSLTTLFLATVERVAGQGY